MKTTNYKITLISLVLFVGNIIISCKNNSSATIINKNSKAPKLDKSEQSANQLYLEGMKILNDRISIQSSNKEKAIEVNKKAIEKFIAAYKADTSIVDPVLFASECTMYGKDYHNCIYWTTKLMKLDTSKRNQLFCIDRISYCNKFLKSEQ